jgi:TATA box binding protein associated factor (TAF)
MSGDKSKKASGLIQTGSLTSDSIKVIAESVGISGLSDDVLHYIGDDVTYRLKFVVQV